MSTELNFDKMFVKYRDLKNSGKSMYLKRGEMSYSNLIEFNVSVSVWDGYKSAEAVFVGPNGKSYTIVQDDEHFEIVSEYEYLLGQKKIIENRLKIIENRVIDLTQEEIEKEI